MFGWFKKVNSPIKCFACGGTTTEECLTEHYTICYKMHVLQGLAKGLSNGTSGKTPNAVRAAMGYPKAHSMGSAIDDPTFSTSGSPKEEVRMTSSTGGQKGVKAERHSLIPKAPLDALARCMAKGALKYSDHNWRKGYEFSKSLDSALRHLLSFIDGEDDDPEIGESHLAAVMFHCSVIITLMETHPEFDDRYKEPNKETKTMIEKNMAAIQEFGRYDLRGNRVSHVDDWLPNDRA